MTDTPPVASEWEKNALAVQAAYLKDRSALASTALTNSREGAKHLVTAAAAIASLYTGAISVVFAVKDNPLPQRGIWALVFLGIAVVLASSYLAPLRSKTDKLRLSEPDAPTSMAELGEFSNNVARIVANMSGYNRRSVIAAVAALGIGVAFMAAPFVGAQPASPKSPTAPALPKVELTGDAKKAYGYQVALYEIELCSNDAAKVVVDSATCDKWGTVAAPKPAGTTTADTDHPSLPADNRSWWDDLTSPSSPDDWSLLLALAGGVIVALCWTFGKRSSEHDPNGNVVVPTVAM